MRTIAVALAAILAASSACAQSVLPEGHWLSTDHTLQLTVFRPPGGCRLASVQIGRDGVVREDGGFARAGPCVWNPARQGGALTIYDSPTNQTLVYPVTYDTATKLRLYIESNSYIEMEKVGGF